MAYQVLARKCRPQDFTSLIGQESIVQAFRNALTHGRVAHAYLFSGIRGVGKTSAARILAKALNCEKGPTADPCNECTACLEITRGGDLDVLEVDAATYSKVEQVRDLTESLKYGPARDRYKIVILDEVHRLSRQAFDALLKIIEEPPPHLVFIFATTELEAVPATILSRCQELHFRRVPTGILASHLASICQSEAIEASETTLRLIARAGEGSVRDSVALLDQMATFGGGRIADKEALLLLGGLDTALFERLLEAILEGGSAEIVATVRQLEEDGRDPRHAYFQFLAYCRDGLHLALGGDPQQVDLPAEERERLHRLATSAGYENLLRLVQQLLAGESTVRRSEMGSLALEVTWLRAAELPKLIRIEDFLAGGSPAGGSAPSAPGQPTRSGSGSGPRTAAAAAPSRPLRGPRAEAAPAQATTQATSPRREEPRKESFRPETAPAAPPSEGGRSQDKVRHFLEEIHQRKTPLAVRLENAESLLFQDGELIISLFADDSALEKALQRASNQQVLDKAVATVWGSGSRWRSRTSSDQRRPEEAAAVSRPDAGPSPSPDELHPMEQTVLSLFDGRVETTEKRQGSHP